MFELTTFMGVGLYPLAGHGSYGIHDIPGISLPMKARSLALLLLLPVASLAADCRVIDPELQGTYAGGCRKGLAHGEGVAIGSAEYRGGFRNGMKHGAG